MKPRITAEEFANWREDPVTQWVMDACEKAAEENKQGWIDASWEAGETSPLLRMELRTRADSYRILAESDWLVWARTHGEYEEETNVVKIA